MKFKESQKVILKETFENVNGGTEGIVIFDHSTYEKSNLVEVEFGDLVVKSVKRNKLKKV